MARPHTDENPFVIMFVFSLFFATIYFLFFYKSNKKVSQDNIFYDMIIDINSFKNLFEKGWTIKFNTQGKKLYEKKKGSNGVTIGVLGHFNKGKSFLLQKISDKKVPKGFNITTRGLSIKYPDIHEQTTVTMLDTAGIGTPICIPEDENKQQDHFKKKLVSTASDTSLTENFIQSFVKKYSDVILLVVGQLTKQEQNLIYQMENDGIEGGGQPNNRKRQTVCIIHNLMNFKEVEHVIYYLNNTIKTSSPVELIVLNNIKNQKQNRYAFQSRWNSGVVHLVLAQENSPAGEYFNENTIEYLKNV